MAGSPPASSPMASISAPRRPRDRLARQGRAGAALSRFGLHVAGRHRCLRVHAQRATDPQTRRRAAARGRHARWRRSHHGCGVALSLRRHQPHPGREILRPDAQHRRWPSGRASSAPSGWAAGPISCILAPILRFGRSGVAVCRCSEREQSDSRRGPIEIMLGKRVCSVASAQPNRQGLGKRERR